MKIVNIQQGGDDWLAWREQGVTATDSVVLLGRSPYKTRWRLWAEKTGFAKPVDLSMNPLVRKGIENEDKARQAMEKILGDLLLPACVESTVDPLIRASLDGLTSKGEPAELKCPSKKVFDEVLEKGENSAAYQMYYPQVQHQLLATGSLVGYLAFYYEGQIVTFTIKADRTMLVHLYQEAKIFWKQKCDKIEPPKDPERDLYIPTSTEAMTWISHADQYRHYEEQIKELKAKVAELEAQQKPHLESLKNMMGEYFHADYCGLMITKYKVKGRISLTSALNDNAINLTEDDLEKYRDPPSFRYRITMDDSLLPRYVVDESVIEPLVQMQEIEKERFYF